LLRTQLLAHIASLAANKDFLRWQFSRLSHQMSDVTCLLDAIQHGDSLAADELLPLVYAELRRLAHARMAQEAPGHTFSRRPSFMRLGCAGRR
jgi:hypothetical protein